jgi:hypothetical protein
MVCAFLVAVAKTYSKGAMVLGKSSGSVQGMISMFDSPRYEIIWRRRGEADARITRFCRRSRRTARLRGGGGGGKGLFCWFAFVFAFGLGGLKDLEVEVEDTSYEGGGPSLSPGMSVFVLFSSGSSTSSLKEDIFIAFVCGYSRAGKEMIWICADQKQKQ